MKSFVGLPFSLFVRLNCKASNFHSNIQLLVMGKRYYCDYCDRSFVDDVQARKKHLKSSGHIRNYRQHYQNYEDTSTFLEREIKKEECFKFLNSGVCAFGNNCYRSHFSRHQLDILRTRYEEETRYRILRNTAEIKTLESWLLKKNNSILTLENLSKSQTGPVMGPHHTFYLNYYSYVPQSLQNIYLMKSADISVAEWG